MVSIITKSGRLIAGENFFIGVCPENANPGEILHDFTNLPRLVGGINTGITKIIKSIYNGFNNIFFISVSYDYINFRYHF